MKIEYIVAIFKNKKHIYLKWRNINFMGEGCHIYVY